MGARSKGSRPRQVVFTAPTRRLDFAAMMRATPARLAVGRAGSRYTTSAMLKLRADHARAMDAVAAEVAQGWLRRAGLIEIRSAARTREEYLLRPECGRRLAAEDLALLRGLFARKARKPRVLLLVSDGLSAAAVHANARALLRELTRRLGPRYTLAPALFVRRARVRIQDRIGEIARATACVMLIGERPGLSTAKSLSAYVIYRPTRKSREPDRTVISNIHRAGLSPAAAAARIAELVDRAIRLRASGSRLAQLEAGGGARGAQRATLARRRAPHYP